MYRSLLAVWLLAAAALLTIVPCTWAGHFGWFFIWQTGAASINFGQIALEEIGLGLVAGTVALLLPRLHPVRH